MVTIDPTTITDLDRARFWAKVDRRGPDECWPWTASRNNDGYGQFCLRRNMIGAHRAAWEITSGANPGELCVLHRCDNPPCVNPEHLWLGTRIDNALDRDAKGRNVNLPGGDAHWSRSRPELVKRGDEHWSRRLPERRASGARNGSRTHPEAVLRGEAHPGRVLTWDKVRWIRRLYATGLYGQTDIGFLLNITATNIYFIVNGKTWCE